jgi:protocatechuate 3,4-dioxygenase beta subunit
MPSPLPLPASPNPRRRWLTLAAGASLSLLAGPASAGSQRTLAAMTDGPFYPPHAWREQWAD